MNKLKCKYNSFVAYIYVYINCYMEDLAKSIVDILYDYHNEHDFTFTTNHVLKWVSQFDENDQEFILKEFLHLLQNDGVYIDEKKARKLLITRIVHLSNRFKFKNPVEFLKNVEFVVMQQEPKSQWAILKMLEQELKCHFTIDFSHCGSVSKRFSIYLDDVIATGGRVYEDCKKWLEQVNDDNETNYQKVVEKNKILIVSVFCKHTWANTDWRLKNIFGDKILNKIEYISDYYVYNHPIKKQQFNFAYPINQNNLIVDKYLQQIEDKAKYKNNKQHAFRNPSLPEKEVFFSSPENRVRFENILVMEGIKILGKTIGRLGPNHRPLGDGPPSFMTLGTGTFFFTWRNISNTSPLVFWWKAHWFPLFPVIGRGV